MQKMTNEQTIWVGDTVTVNFNGAMTTLCHRANVISKPSQTGESWIFEDLDNGNIHYVSEGCTVTKLNITDEK